MLTAFISRFLPVPPLKMPDSSAPNPPQTDEQRVLVALSSPLTKGELSDQVNLPYRQLDPILAILKAQSQITTEILCKHGFACIHYVRRG